MGEARTQKATECVIPGIGNVQNRHIYRDRKQNGGCQGGAAPGAGVVGISSGTRQRLWVHNMRNVLNATASYTLKQLISCYVNWTSIKKHRKPSQKVSLYGK